MNRKVWALLWLEVWGYAAFLIAAVVGVVWLISDYPTRWRYSTLADVEYQVADQHVRALAGALAILGRAPQTAFMLALDVNGDRTIDPDESKDADRFFERVTKWNAAGCPPMSEGATAKSLALARELRFMREGLPAGAFSAALMELDEALRARKNCVLHLSTKAENTPALAIIYDAATDVVRIEAWEGGK